MEEFLFYENTGNDLIIAIAIFIAVLVVGFITKSKLISFIENMTARTSTKMDDLAIDILKKLKFDFYYAIGLVLAILYLSIPETLENIIIGILWIWIVFRLIGVIQNVVNFLIENYLLKSRDQSMKSIGQFISSISNVLVWIVAILFVISNFGVNINSIIAGLSIGGLAIAFALQKVFEDLFASFVIFSNEPFKVGDDIFFNNQLGKVEKIGLRSTRIITSDQRNLIVPNKEITAQVVENYKTIKHRRVGVVFHIDPHTSAKKIEPLPEMIEELMKEKDIVKVCKSIFLRFGSEFYRL